MRFDRLDLDRLGLVLGGEHLVLQVRDAVRDVEAIVAAELYPDDERARALHLAGVELGLAQALRPEEVRPKEGGDG